MPRKITIHKATHKFFTASGTLAIAVGQLRGDMLYLNRIDDAGQVVEKSWAVGTCAYHLTGYGKGIAPHEALSVESMQGAWAFTFGIDIPPPAFCEVHKES